MNSNNLNYILIDTNNNNNILGLYNNLNVVLNNLLDNYILQFITILDILKQNNYYKLSSISNFYKVKTILMNSNITTKEIYFSFKNFIFYDNDNNTNYFCEDDYNFTNKINTIKVLYNQIIDTNNHKDLNIFIPNDIFNNSSNYQNNIIEPHNLNETNYESNLSVNFNEKKYNNFNNNDNNQEVDTINNEVDSSNKLVNDNNQKVDTRNNLVNENNNEVDSSNVEEEKKKLLEKIKNLEKNYNDSNNNIEKIKKTINDSESFINENSNVIENLEKINKLSQEYNELKLKFNANEIVYNKIKDKIISEEMEIPEIFIYDYEIFKYLEENNITKYEKKLNFYIEKYPKNINYHTKCNLLF